MTWNGLEHPTPKGKQSLGTPDLKSEDFSHLMQKFSHCHVHEYRHFLIIILPQVLEILVKKQKKKTPLSSGKFTAQELVMPSPIL